jgi:serine/threonine-protein kinase
MSQPAASAADDADLTGRTLGDFKLLRRLGRGAMAEVYLAEQQTLRRQVALKVLKVGLAGDASYVQRFRNEAQAAAALVHANIVQIYEVGCADGVHYIAQEYVQGMNLREWMSRNGPPDAKLAVAVMRQVAAALNKAAQTGIVHRDIKPENIMLSRTGEVKVADFGLARIAREDDVLHLTQVGITMGTPLYMSPEQVEGKPLDGRSDLYSFGVTCYHLLTGAPPFSGDTALAVAVQHLNAQPRRLEEVRPDLPPGLARIVHRAMEKKPKNRYDTARDLLADLRTLPITADDDAEAWAAALDQTALEMSVTAGLHSAAGKLNEAMKTSALALRKRDEWLRRLAITAAVAFVVGGVAAVVKARRTPSVLERSTSSAETVVVPKQESARQQFVAAQFQLENVEEWLKSVEKYYPNDVYVNDRAKQELARYYWKNDRLDEAMELFDRFADRLEEEYRAFGLAGQSLVLTKRGNLERAAQVLGQLLPLGDKLDSRMAAELQYAVAANEHALRDKGVLPKAPPTSPVPKQASAQQQYDFAMLQLGDKEKEDSLAAVQLYFPQDLYYVTSAKEELGKLFLQLDRLPQATQIFADLAAREPSERSARACGLAGQAIIAMRQDNVAQAARTLDQLRPLNDAIESGLAAMLAQALTGFEAKLPKQTVRDWQPWRTEIQRAADGPKK